MFTCCFGCFLTGSKKIGWANLFVFVVDFWQERKVNPFTYSIALFCFMGPWKSLRPNKNYKGPATAPHLLCFS